MRIVFMGSPEFAVATLELLLLNGHNVAAVYTRPDKPGGRGRLQLPTPVKAAACRYGIPVLQPATLKSGEAQAELTAFAPEAIVVAAFGQLLPAPILTAAPYGCVNIHPSLLPKYRGPAPVPAAILAGDAFAGVSVMKLDEGMDSGPVFCRAQIPILDQDTTGGLLEKLFQTGTHLLLQVLADLQAGRAVAIPQDEAAATSTQELTKEDGRIDWRRPALEIWRQVRAFQPWPGAYTFWQGKQVKIIEAGVEGGGEKVPTGRVVVREDAASGQGAVAIGTGAGYLIVKVLQIEGKRAMPTGEFLKGQREFVGAVLV